jgi:hypothetical protein
MMEQPHRTQLVLGTVFTALGAMLLGLGGLQLAVWWNRSLSGLTIEPIVLPMGAVFVAFGLPRLLRARRELWLARHGVVVPAEVLTVVGTNEVIDKKFAVVRVTLRVEPPGAPHFTTELRWPVGFTPMTPGRRVEVRHRPGHPHWVAPI